MKIPPKCQKAIRRCQELMERLTDEEAELTALWVAFTVVHSNRTRRGLSTEHDVHEHLKVSYNRFCDDIKGNAT